MAEITKFGGWILVVQLTKAVSSTTLDFCDLMHGRAMIIGWMNFTELTSQLSWLLAVNYFNTVNRKNHLHFVSFRPSKPDNAVGLTGLVIFFLSGIDLVIDIEHGYQTVYHAADARKL